MTPAELEHYLHAHIPISGPLGVRVAAASAAAVQLAAPLAPNLNHRETAFGGSLSAVAILAGWSLLRLRLGDGFRGRLVIQTHTMEYVAPAEADFVAECRPPDAAAWQEFTAALERRGRARVELTARVTVGGTLVARSVGRYVAIAGEPEG